MRKIPFLIFTAAVIIAASICILSGFEKEIIAGTIVGFICGLTSAVSIITSKQANVGEIMKLGITIGVVLAILIIIILNDIGSMSDIHRLGIAIFAFIGSTLGSIVGCMYEKTN